MQLSIEPNNGMPIFEQVMRQIKFAVAEGTLVPGQLLPSVRLLAKKTGRQSKHDSARLSRTANRRRCWKAFADAASPCVRALNVAA